MMELKWLQLWISAFLPVSVLLVGWLTTRIANKKRNDDLFDRRFVVYEKTFLIWAWMIAKHEGVIKGNPFPPHNMTAKEIINLRAKSLFLFGDKIGGMISDLITDAINWNNDQFYFYDFNVSYNLPQKEFNVKQFDEIPWRKYLECEAPSLSILTKRTIKWILEQLGQESKS